MGGGEMGVKRLCCGEGVHIYAMVRGARLRCREGLPGLEVCGGSRALEQFVGRRLAWCGDFCLNLRR